MFSTNHNDHQRWLSELQAEIARLRDAGVVIPPTLASLLAEVEAASVSPPVAIPEVIAHMQRDVAEFEVSHPRLTNIANDILQSLSGMGI